MTWHYPELQVVAKTPEALAILTVISDIFIVNTELPPPPSPLPPLINAVMDLVMTFKVTSNNIERGRGVSGLYLS